MSFLLVPSVPGAENRLTGVGANAGEYVVWLNDRYVITDSLEPYFYEESSRRYYYPTGFFYAGDPVYREYYGGRWRDYLLVHCMNGEWSLLYNVTFPRDYIEYYDDEFQTWGGDKCYVCAEWDMQRRATFEPRGSIHGDGTRITLAPRDIIAVWSHNFSISGDPDPDDPCGVYSVDENTTREIGVESYEDSRGAVRNMSASGQSMSGGFVKIDGPRWVQGDFSPGSTYYASSGDVSRENPTSFHEVTMDEDGNETIGEEAFTLTFRGLVLGGTKDTIGITEASLWR